MQITPVTTAGGVLFRWHDAEYQVLLIYKKGVWDLPKGKMEGEESIQECARREVAEEVGCPPPRVHGKLIKTYHEYDEGQKHFGKTTHWFPMQTEQQDGFTPEEQEGITEVAWFSLPVATQKVGYENLKSVLGALGNWLEEHPRKK